MIKSQVAVGVMFTCGTASESRHSLSQCLGGGGAQVADIVTDMCLEFGFIG